LNSFGMKSHPKRYDSCDVFASPACAVLMRGAEVRSLLGRAYARTKQERVGRSGRGHCVCMRLCLSCAGVLGSLTRPAVRCWWRFQVQGRIGGACRQSRRGNWKFAPPSSLIKTRQQCNTQYAPGNERPPCAFQARFDARPSKIGNPVIVQPVYAVIGPYSITWRRWEHD